MFKKLNKNPYKADIGDCFIRAMSVAFKMPYMEVLKDYVCSLVHYFSKDKLTSEWQINNFYNLSYYLEQNGYTKYSVKGLIRTLAKKNVSGYPALVYCTGHLTVLDGKGNYVDSWDCGKHRSRFIFIKNKEVEYCLKQHIIEKAAY